MEGREERGGGDVGPVGARGLTLAKDRPGHYHHHY